MGGSLSAAEKRKRRLAVEWFEHSIEEASRDLEASPQKVLGRGDYWEEVCGALGRETARKIMYRGWLLALFREIGLGKNWGLVRMCAEMANREVFDSYMFYWGGEQAAIKLYEDEYNKRYGNL